VCAYVVYKVVCVYTYLHRHTRWCIRLCVTYVVYKVVCVRMWLYVCARANIQNALDYARIPAPLSVCMCVRVYVFVCVRVCGCVRVCV